MPDPRHFLFLVLLLLYHHRVTAQQCEAPGSYHGCATAASSSSSLYRFGGTAQAYKPRSPVKNTICEPSNTTVPYYRVATWPYRRASYSSAKMMMPELVLSVSLMTCGGEKESSTKKASSCCCQPWNTKSSATVEAWQARPDGTFSSLRPGVQDGDCRAQLEANKGAVEFQTLPPGSYGSLSGLGPNKWDFMPYGEPVIHFLVTAPGHAPTLVDVPIYFHWASLESRSFGWNDWRGTAWVRQTMSTDSGYKILSWKSDHKRRSISVSLNLFMQPSGEDSSAAASDASSSSHAEEMMCESLLYGLPSSFFREPMAVCASSLLDLFTL